MRHWQPEADIGTPWWWEAAPPETTDDAMPSRCDVAVIGAGYTGLSAAIAAQDAGASVVVLEAGIPGQGASSRNGGMFGAHPRLSRDRLAGFFGGEVADAVLAEATPALDWACGFITREEIDCDYAQTGRIQLAWTPAHARAQGKLVETLQQAGKVRVERLGRSDLGREIETQRYHGAIVFPDHGALHPAKYHRGMLAAARRRGIPVVSHAPVTRMEKDGTGYQLSAPCGTLRADRIVLASNGYTGRPFRWHARRVFPLPSYMIATEELPANLLGHLAPGRRMMVETRARHSYFRLSPDGKRVLFGGRASMRDVPLAAAAERLRRTMVEIWPDLSEARISHAWSGYTGFSFRQMPHVGMQEGVAYAMGFSGSGTVMAPYLGARAGWLAVGDARAETAYQNTPFARHMLHCFDRPHFLKAADLWYRHGVDWWENLQSRRG
ncbi:MAG: FAD-binding oxidoreductase [Pseudomonadota bacterium]